jgi:23S rRNA pseudouridine2605 synthase/16S rRNA pseudouridine516 synthase
MRAPSRPDTLARALARAGLLPFGIAEEAIAAGRVSVNGRKGTALMALPKDAVVKLDGLKVSLAWGTRVLALHKPPGVVTSTEGTHGASTVFQVLLPQLPAGLSGYGWHAVGRLDKDTTGLLLFSNDERFVEHATQPEHHLARRYVAKVSGKVNDEKLQRLQQPMRLDDGLTKPAQARLRANGTLELTLTEGRNHQVKRMLSQVGLPTLSLHRDALGALVLDVEEGQYRELTAREVREDLGFALFVPAPGSAG